jgi:putative membrane protein insertion efficiency factor
MKLLAALLEMPRRLLQLTVRGYQLFLSPWLGGSCRFEPTCSAYALVALQRHGALRGSGLALYRVARCSPLCRGGHDPVPEVLRPLFASSTSRSPKTVGPSPSTLIDKTSHD